MVGMTSCGQSVRSAIALPRFVEEPRSISEPNPIAALERQDFDDLAAVAPPLTVHSASETADEKRRVAFPAEESQIPSADSRCAVNFFKASSSAWSMLLRSFFREAKQENSGAPFVGGNQRAKAATLALRRPRNPLLEKAATPVSVKQPG